MAEDSFQERTESATPQRREEFRQKGKVAQSRDMVMIASFLGVVGLFHFYGTSFLAKCSSMLGHWIENSWGMDQLDAGHGALLRQILISSIDILWPVLLTGFCITILVHLSQIGFLFVTDSLTFEWGRINPMAGFGRLFSLRNLVELFKSILKFTIVAVLGYIYFLKIAAEAQGWMNLSTLEQIQVGMASLSYLVMGIGVTFIVLSIFDYGFQRFDLERSMRMTKQEIKEETKLREGDPLIRARVRSIQRERARRRMMQDVSKATVVVTNPTHFAIALRYEPSEMAAPRVVAKGAEFVAHRIKEIAARNSVPIVENKPLARILYRTVKVGHFIPRELYHAVAEVLAYVYRLRRRFAPNRELRT